MNEDKPHCEALDDKVNHEVRLMRIHVKEFGPMNSWDLNDYKQAYFSVMGEYYCKTQCTKRIGCQMYKNHSENI